MKTNQHTDQDLAELVQCLDNLHENVAVQIKIMRIGQRAVPALVAFLNGPPSQLSDGRVLAAEALGAIRSRQAVGGLIAVLDANPFSELSPLLRLSEETVRNAAARELGRIGDRRAVPALLRALREDRLVGAAEGLVAFKEEQALPFLIQGLEDAFKRDRFAEAISSFGQVSVPYLIEGFGIRHTREGFESLTSIERRAMILRLLGELGTASATDAILAGLRHERPAVRVEAAVAAANVVTDERLKWAIPILKEGLEHPDFMHRDRCREALALIARHLQGDPTVAEEHHAQ